VASNLPCNHRHPKNVFNPGTTSFFATSFLFGKLNLRKGGGQKEKEKEED
jgi:hypothetical protein